MLTAPYAEKLRNVIKTIEKSKDSITRDELEHCMKQLTGNHVDDAMTKEQIIQKLYVLEDDLQQIENDMM